MMQTVPCCSPQSVLKSSIPSFNENFDLDLDLLPIDCQAPNLVEYPLLEDFYCAANLKEEIKNSTYYDVLPLSPANTLSPGEAQIHSPIMFSPMEQKATQTQDKTASDGYSPKITVPDCSPFSNISSDSFPLGDSRTVKTFHDKKHVYPQHKIQCQVAPPPYEISFPSSVFPTPGRDPCLNAETTVQIKIEPMEPSFRHPDLKRAMETAGQSTSFNFGVCTEPSFPKLKEDTKGDCEESSSSDIKIEPVLSLAMEQVKNDIEIACRLLNISHGKVFPPYFILCTRV